MTEENRVRHTSGGHMAAHKGSFGGQKKPTIGSWKNTAYSLELYSTTIVETRETSLPLFHRVASTGIPRTLTGTKLANCEHSNFGHFTPKVIVNTIKLDKNDRRKKKTHFSVYFYSSHCSRTFKMSFKPETDTSRQLFTEPTQEKSSN